MKLAEGTNTSRVMVNQPQAASNSGNLWNGMRQTFSLGCGSWGGNGTNNNITWRDLINETWVSKPAGHAQDAAERRGVVRRRDRKAWLSARLATRNGDETKVRRRAFEAP